MQPARRPRGRVGIGREGRIEEAVELGAVEGRGAAELEAHAVRDVDADPTVEPEALGAVRLEPPGHREAQARDAIAEGREAGRVEAREAEGEVDRAVAARDAALRLLGAVAAGLDREGGLGRAAAAPRDDVDDAAHGVRAVERRLRSAQHLDALDVGEDERREVELAPGRDRVVDPDAVDHHQGVAHVAAADAHGLDVARAAGSG